MCQEETIIIVAVPMLLQEDGNLVSIERLTRELGVGDIVVVGNTSILRSLLMIGGVDGMQLILIAPITCIEGSTEMTHTLILVVTAGISIVHVEAYAQTFADINSEFGVEMVFTILFVATVIVGEVGDRGEGLREMTFIGGLHHLVINIKEPKLRLLPAVYEDAVLACGIVCANGIILSVFPSGQRALGEEMGHCVNLGRDDVAELAVHSPYLDALGYLLAAAGGVVLVGTECVAALIVLRIRHVESVITLFTDALSTQRLAACEKEK